MAVNEQRCEYRFLAPKLAKLLISLCACRKTSTMAALLLVLLPALLQPRSAWTRAAVHLSASPTLPEAMPAAEAYALLQSGGATLLDVRQPAEYRLDGHAPAPVRSINVPSHSWEHGFYLPLDSFASDALAELGAGLDGPVIVACADGRLAASAAVQLRDAGLARCACCEGGLRALEAEGMELALDEDGEAGLPGAWV